MIPGKLGGVRSKGKAGKYEWGSRYRRAAELITFHPFGQLRIIRPTEGRSISPSLTRRTLLGVSVLSDYGLPPLQRKSAVGGLNSEKGVLSSHMLLSQTLPPR